MAKIKKINYRCGQEFADHADVARYFLDHAYSGDWGIFPQCLRINKTFHDIGKSILWRDVKVCPRNMDQFLQALRSSPLIDLDVTRSITVIANEESSISRWSHHALHYQTLMELVKWFTKMQKLKILSFSNFVYLSYNLDTHIASSAVQSLKTLMHKNIKDLEFRHVLFHPRDDPQDDHICSCIKQILPQLRRLRVSRTQICPTLMQDFDTKCEALEELVLNFDGRTICRDCTRLDHRDHDTPNDREKAADQLVQYAQNALSLGYFPKLAHFFICGTRIYLPYINASSRKFVCLYTVDLIKQTTTVYPAIFLAYDEVRAMRQRFGLDDNKTLLAWMLVRDFASTGQRGLVCEVEEMHDLVNEGRPWMTTSKGLRVPRGGNLDIYTCTERTKLESMFAQEQVLRSMAFDRYKQPKGDVIKCPLFQIWYWEEKSGRALLHICTLPGTAVPPFPERETCAAEARLNLEIANDSSEAQRFARWLDKRRF